MSVPAGLLDETNRADICRFWGEVFGFEEHPQMTEDRHRLVLGACHYEQFVFLIAEDEPMQCPRLDHYGLSVRSLHDLEAAYARAQAFARDRRSGRPDRALRRGSRGREDPLVLRGLPPADDA